MLSSTVVGLEDTIEQAAAMLRGYGYDVLSSHLGTIMPRPGQTVPEACVEAVGHADYLVGIIQGRYGSAQQGASGLGDDDVSITHLEQRRAASLDAPRVFFVDRRVDVARSALRPVLDRITPTPVDGNDRPIWDLPLAAGQPNPYARSSVLSDLRVLAMLEEAEQGGGGAWVARTGNWCQRYDRSSHILTSLPTLFGDPHRLRADLNAYAAARATP